MTNFWQQFKKPIIALAPMAGITDRPFRIITSRFGADVVYTEMASVAALQFRPAKTLELLRSAVEEAPVVMQIFGSNPDQFARAARLLSKAELAQEYYAGYRVPAGLDINFGCPVSKVVKTGSGAQLFQDLDRARAVIEAVLANTTLPVSIKIRTAAGAIDFRQFLTKMSDLPIAALMIHGRSLVQGFAGPIDTKIIREARDYFKGIILANGGINSVVSAQAVLAGSGADGIGLARGVLSKPWLFKSIKEGQEITLEFNAVLDLILEHARLASTDNPSLVEFRKYLCWYLSGWPKAREYRQQAVTVNVLADVERLVAAWRLVA